MNNDITIGVHIDRDVEAKIRRLERSLGLYNRLLFKHNSRDKYLTLLSDCLCFALWDSPLRPIRRAGIVGRIDRFLRKGGLALATVPQFRAESGLDWPALAHTMVGSRRLQNIRELCESVDADGVPGPICILRADGDMYSSTETILNQLYRAVSPGGYVIIDDWAIPMCRQAVQDFRQREEITCTIHDIDGVGVYWRKSA